MEECLIVMEGQVECASQEAPSYFLDLDALSSAKYWINPGIIPPD